MSSNNLTKPHRGYEGAPWAIPNAGDRVSPVVVPTYSPGQIRTGVTGSKGPYA